MSNQSNDELARALAGLSSGEHHEPDEHHDAHTHDDHIEHHDDHAGAHPTPPAAPPSAPRQAASRAPAAGRQAPAGQSPAAPRGAAPARPAGAQAARPAGPAGQAPRPATPGARPPAPQQRASAPAPAPPGRPVAPSVPTQRINRPVTPGNVPPMAPQRPGQRPVGGAPAAGAQPSIGAQPARPASPSGVARPAAPGIGRPATPASLDAYAQPTHEQAAAEPAAVLEGVAIQLDGKTAGYQGDDHAASGLESVVADDADEVNVPPPPMEYLGHTHHVPSPNAPAVAPKYHSLGYQRTLIPILLTTGLCMGVLGACRFLLPEDTALGSLPMFIPFVLFGAGGIALVFGVLTMFQVKNTLDAQARAREAAPAAAAT